MTEENNKLIAEFMGLKEPYELPQHGTIRPNGEFKTEFELHQLKYHKEWNWLMPVVDKIEGLKAVVDIHRHWGALAEDEVEDMYFCIIKTNEEHKIDVAWEDSKIKATYKAVVEFIKWHNESA